MNHLLYNILLAMAWTLLTGEATIPSFSVGLVIGYLLLWVSRSALGGEAYFRKIPLVFMFLLFFIKELIIANLKVAFDILTPKDYMEPGIIAFPLAAKTDLEITLFANLLTLTPGTLSLDVSDDRKTLYVHALYVKKADTFRKELKEGLEKRLLDVLR
ncbi:MAG: Na+/H+ antiporter subunit E [Chlorobiaceae bacterium]|jgi:multicomponent Na+:H+ antiporter subunit E|nr:Na+/H+ antiporter subunit E [Chlorobiaceae bacterium]